MRNAVVVDFGSKDVSAQGIILLPEYTVTVIDKSESVGGKPFAFKVRFRWVLARVFMI